MEPPSHPSTESEHASSSRQASLPHFDSGEASTCEILSVSSASGFSTAPPLPSLKLVVPTRVGRDGCSAPKSGPTGLPAGVAERTSTAWPSGPVTFDPDRVASSSERWRRRCWLLPSCPHEFRYRRDVRGTRLRPRQAGLWKMLAPSRVTSPVPPRPVDADTPALSSPACAGHSN